MVVMEQSVTGGHQAFTNIIAAVMKEAVKIIAERWKYIMIMFQLRITAIQPVGLLILFDALWINQGLKT
jgi:hypothetical protein